MIWHRNHNFHWTLVQTIRLSVSIKQMFIQRIMISRSKKWVICRKVHIGLTLTQSLRSARLTLLSDHLLKRPLSPSFFRVVVKWDMRERWVVVLETSAATLRPRGSVSRAVLFQFSAPLSWAHELSGSLMEKREQTHARRRNILTTAPKYRLKLVRE